MQLDPYAGPPTDQLGSAGYEFPVSETQILYKTAVRTKMDVKCLPRGTFTRGAPARLGKPLRFPGAPLSLHRLRGRLALLSDPARTHRAPSRAATAAAPGEGHVARARLPQSTSAAGLGNCA